VRNLALFSDKKRIQGALVSKLSDMSEIRKCLCLPEVWCN